VFIPRSMHFMLCQLTFWSIETKCRLTDCIYLRPLNDRHDCCEFYMAFVWLSGGMLNTKRLSICIVHHRVYTPLMRFLSPTRAADRTAATCSLQTQAGAPAGQAAQSAVQRSPPSVTHIMDYYSFNWPRRDGRLSWPRWLTDSGRHTHKVVKQPSISLAKDKESPPARTDILTTMLRHHYSLTHLLLEAFPLGCDIRRFFFVLTEDTKRIRTHAVSTSSLQRNFCQLAVWYGHHYHVIVISGYMSTVMLWLNSFTCYCLFPLSSSRQHFKINDCLEDKRENY